MKTKTAARWTARILERPMVGMTFAAALALFPFNVSAAGGHPEATLESDRSTVDAGGSVGLRGAEFGGNGTYTLRLLGALNEHDLGEATSDGEGIFQLNVTVPVDVRPGSYQIVAIASDGDVSARLDLTVSAAMPMNADDHADMDGVGMSGQAATADEISIERDRSGIGWAAIGLVIGAAGGLGIGMRRGQHAS